MNFTLDFDDEAAEAMRSLSPHTKSEVNKVLKRLRFGPDRSLDKELQDVENMWGARAGRRWRVVFSVLPGRHIRIRRIRRRPDAYEGIEHPGRQDIEESAPLYSSTLESVTAAALD